MLNNSPIVKRVRAIGVHRHSVPQLLIDGGLVTLAYYLAFQLRFDRGVPERYSQLLETTLPWVIVGSVVVFALFGLYHKWWRFVGQRDYEAILRAAVVSTLALAGLIALIHPVSYRTSDGLTGVNLPAGVVALYFLLLLVLLLGSRFVIHIVIERPIRGFRATKDARDVLIVGAGDGGQLVLREIVRNPELGYRPVGFVDDDPRKQGMRLAGGLRVLGSTNELAHVIEESDPAEVIIAIPSAPGTLRGRVVSVCRERGIPVRTLPTVFELLQTDRNMMRQVRDVQVEDVLGREPVLMDLSRVGAYLAGRVVMVTGAGGSIGAELCRQIARVGVRSLVLVDHAEQTLFEIQRELTEDRHFRGTVGILADCKEEDRMRSVLSEHRPSVIFHAAAYKHVGMMETNPVEALRNNAFATRLLAGLAGESGVERFVLVSTDKAVSPATVMGASKLFAELAVEEAAARYPQTRYGSVRFGNVLGSSGSVVPIFRRQIEAGGPLTVTDPDMMRFFMTIPESVQLIIRAASLGENSEIFVLEMGEPVSILELARDMIALSGLEPERDIAIEFIGRRPGEKIREELFNPYERPQATAAEKILRVEREQLPTAAIGELFTELQGLLKTGDRAALASGVVALAERHRTHNVASPT